MFFFEGGLHAFILGPFWAILGHIGEVLDSKITQKLVLLQSRRQERPRSSRSVPFFRLGAIYRSRASTLSNPPPAEIPPSLGLPKHFHPWACRNTSISKRLAIGGGVSEWTVFNSPPITGQTNWTPYIDSRGPVLYN